MSGNFCTRCGAALGPGGAFCTACGAPTGAGVAPAQDQFAPAPPQIQPPPGYAQPAASPAAAPVQRASGWGWKRWLLLIVGALALLSGLRQLGILPGRDGARDERGRAMVGRWAGTSECRGAMTFNADGTYSVHTGATARWRMDGDRLVLSGDGAGQLMRLVEWTPNSLTFLMGETRLRYTMVRC